MRNVFDQYVQPENKLTHALITTLHNEPKLVRPFLKFAGIDSIPLITNIEIGEQSLPGQKADETEQAEDSVPDAYFCDHECWAVLVESKVQAGISLDQLSRHSKKAERFGYSNCRIILITVELCKKALPKHVINVLWKDIYSWFVKKYKEHVWVRHFINYMEIFESKMLANNYNIGGTITMFSGFHFDKDNPYTYREGKRLIRLLGQEFRKNKALINILGIDPEQKGRTAITEGESGIVWDCIPLKSFKGSNFTSHPHATMSLNSIEATVALTLPNGIKRGIKKSLNEKGIDFLRDTICKIEKDLRSVIETAPGTKPMIYLEQRHYKSQRSHPVTDGCIKVDIRTIIEDRSSGLKHQPMWLDGIFNIISTKKTNIQFAIVVIFPYTAKCMQTDKALDVMTKALIALKPFLNVI